MHGRDPLIFDIRRGYNAFLNRGSAQLVPSACETRIEEKTAKAILRHAHERIRDAGLHRLTWNTTERIEAFRERWDDDPSLWDFAVVWENPEGTEIRLDALHLNDALDEVILDHGFSINA